MIKFLQKWQTTLVQAPSWKDGIAVAFILCITVSGLILQTYVSSFFRLTEFGWSAVATLAIFAYLIIGWARGGKLWSDFLARKRGNSLGKIARDEPNPFSELFVYLIVALSLLASIALSAVGSSWLWPWQVDLLSPWQASLYFGALIAAFLPLFLGFRTLANKVYGADYKPNHISRQSVYCGLLIVGLIVCLAWAASSKFIPESDPFFGAYILGLVLVLFLGFVSVPHVQAFLQRPSRIGSPSVLSDASRAGFVPPDPAVLVSAFDSFLVRSVAPLSGAVQHNRNGFPLLPHALLIGVFVPLTAMGFALPAPYGLAPILFATLLAVGLGRRWSWVEADRETAMRIHKLKDENIRIGFLNDLRDEALLGYAFLFVLIPLALRQIQLWVAPFAPVAADLEAHGSLIAWAQFFGTELAKGVPIVDWADIYGLKSTAPFKANNPLSQHLVFASRLLVDIVIIAALLQAWGIVRRNSDQLTLFKDGQLDLLDPFEERARFRRGVILGKSGAVEFKPELKALFDEHAENARKKNNGRLIPYDERRISELLNSRDHKIRSGAEKLSKDYSLLVGTVFNQIEILFRRMKSYESRLDDPSHWEWTSEQRYTFESLLRWANEANNYLNKEYVLILREMVSLISDKPSFFDAKLMAYELMGRQRTRYGVFALASAILPIENYGVVGLSRDTQLSEQWGFGRERHQDVREAVIRAVEYLGTDRDNDRKAGQETRKLCFALLEWAVLNETSKPREAALAALRRMKGAT